MGGESAEKAKDVSFFVLEGRHGGRRQVGLG